MSDRFIPKTPWVEFESGEFIVSGPIPLESDFEYPTRRAQARLFDLFRQVNLGSFKRSADDGSRAWTYDVRAKTVPTESGRFPIAFAAISRVTLLDIPHTVLSGPVIAETFEDLEIERSLIDQAVRYADVKRDVRLLETQCHDEATAQLLVNEFRFTKANEDGLYTRSS